MGTAASIPGSVGEALKAGYSPEDIDAYVKSQKGALAVAAAAAPAAAAGVYANVPSKSPAFVKRVEDLFEYINASIDNRNEDGHITTQELVAFFGETSLSKTDAAKDAKYWLKEIDGYGENNGYITLSEMSEYFDSLSMEEAVEALEELESYEDYDQPTAAAKILRKQTTNGDAKFIKRVKDLFAYIDESIDERNEDGHITTQDLVAFFGETSTKADAAKNAKYWLQEIDGYGENNGYITLDEMLDYFYSLSLEDAYAALEELEAYEGYDAAGNDIRNKSPEFIKRVEDLFAYIDESIDERNEDGHITTQELVAFFGETSTKADAAKDAKYWLQEMDGYGGTDGYITLDEMLKYFNSLSVEEAVEALEELEAYEGYDAPTPAASAAPAAATAAGPFGKVLSQASSKKKGNVLKKGNVMTRRRSQKAIDATSDAKFVKRVEGLFAYIDESIDDRNEDGYIIMEELITFFGETSTKGEAKKNANYWLKEIDGFGETDGYITLDELLDYFDSLSVDEAWEALEELESYEGYDAAGNDIRNKSPEFIKRVEDLFGFIDGAIDKRNEDGYITTRELYAFFGETSTKADAAKDAKYWLQEMDGYGGTDGYITLDEMLKYFNSLSVEEAVEALEELEAYEGYKPGLVHTNSKGVGEMSI